MQDRIDIQKMSMEKLNTFLVDQYRGRDHAQRELQRLCANIDVLNQEIERRKAVNPVGVQLPKKEEKKTRDPK